LLATPKPNGIINSKPLNPQTSKRLVISILAALLVQPALSRAQPLPQDSRNLTGRFENGVIWIYREHNTPPGKMALMMHVRTGSLNETDAQKGLAHFLEHMSFNGSEHFPPGKLVPYFESIGMQFGADLNAFTSFDQTAYMLFTPDTTTNQIDKALTVLSDYAFRDSLVVEEIDKERGVVLEESRTGKGTFQRIRDKLWPELFVGSRFATRLPIGDDKILANARKAEFVDYYNTWYRPSNVTVVLVGDAKAEPIIPLIKKWFGEVKPAAAARHDLGPAFKPFKESRAIVVTDPEMAYCQVEMLNIRPGRPPTTTVPQWRTSQVEALGSWIMGRRFDDRVKQGKASYRGANASVSDFFHDGLLITGSAEGEARDWAKMLDEIIVEIARAREFGFTARELALAKKEFLANAERAVRTEPTENARGLINQIVASVNEREPLLSAQQELDLYRKLLPGITLPEVSASFKDHFTPGSFAYVLTMSGKDPSAVPSRETVFEAAAAALARKVEPLKEDASALSLLEKEPTPGKVVERAEEKDLGITSAWLENGVRVHHRYMDYKKDSVWVSIALAGGDIEETATNKGSTAIATLAVNEAATHRLSSTAIRDLMTGKNISVYAGGMGDSFTLNISGSPRDLQAGLELAYSLLTDGLIEESAFSNWKLSTLQNIEQRERMPPAKAGEAWSELTSGKDPRQMPLTRENVEALSLQKGQAWFERLCHAPIEVAVVGDIQLADALPLVEKYIGSLPKRGRSAAYLDSLRHLNRQAGPLARQVEVETETPQAVARAGFIGCEGRNRADARALEVAANILTSRLVKRIREDESLVYSISAFSAPAWIYADAGQFSSGAPCDPANAARVVEEIHQMFQAMADKGPTAEELDNAKKQIDNHLETAMREPTYWAGILRAHDLQGRNLDDEKNARKLIAQYTVEQVQAVFKKYYTPARQLRVIATPVKPKPPA
jgi:zinc protease